MKGILVHSTTIKNLSSILKDGYLYDSSKTDPNFGEGDTYKDMLSNKIFFQLVFENIKITGDYDKDRGFENSILLFFDTELMEEYGNKKYSKKKEDKSKLKNKIPNTKVWFNPSWAYGNFTRLSKKGVKKSIDYDPEIKLGKNIKIFYEAKLQYIKDHINDDLEEYEELLEYNEGKLDKEEEKWWKEHFDPKMPKTFTRKAENEVVFQSKKISLKDPAFLGIYTYNPENDKYKKLESKYSKIKFLSSPKKLQSFLKNYYNL